MRAPFNNTVTLFDGPGTATPGFPRIVNAPCRLVGDSFFVDTDDPLDLSTGYFTIQGTEPLGPVTTDLGGDVWQYDFTKADTAVFASDPLITWQVVRVELCTWPDPGAPYYRASIVKLEPEPPTCSAAYHDTYNTFRMPSGYNPTFVRYSPTQWADGPWQMFAENSEPDAGCISEWIITNDDSETWRVLWDGLVAAVFLKDGDPSNMVIVTPAP